MVQGRLVRIVFRNDFVSGGNPIEDEVLAGPWRRVAQE